MMTSDPRICLLTGSFHPVVGGGETHARLLCAELRRRGVSVCVVTRHRVKTSPVDEVVDGVPVHRVSPSGVPRLGKYLMMLPAFLRLVRTRRDYDVIYVCGLRILGIVGALAAIVLGKRCVLRSESRGELSGGFIWERTDGRTRPVMKRLFGWLVGLRNVVLRESDAFLSISSVIRDEYLVCGVPSARIAAIPNGIDTARFAPVGAGERQALRQRLSLPEGRLFAYTGKLNRGKGLEFLLRVWNDWVKTHPECKLVLIGSGAMQFLSCESELREYVRTQGLESSVLFAGNVTNVPDYLKVADGFLFASESEAMPLALLEALSTGLPAIASDIAAHHDIVTAGQDGWLAPCNDAAAWTRCLDECVAQPERAKERGARGRQTVMTRFSMPHVADEHMALFQSVCARGKAVTA